MKYQITLEKTMRTSFEVEVDDVCDIGDAIGNYENHFDKNSYIDYDWAACDEDGKTVVDWS